MNEELISVGIMFIEKNVYQYPWYGCGSIKHYRI